MTILKKHYQERQTARNKTFDLQSVDLAVAIHLNRRITNVPKKN